MTSPVTPPVTSPVWIVLAVITWAVWPVFMGWRLRQGLRRGVIRTHPYTTYSRSREPISFWTTVAFYVAGLVGWVLFPAMHLIIYAVTGHFGGPVR